MNSELCTQSTLCQQKTGAVQLKPSEVTASEGRSCTLLLSHPVRRAFPFRFALYLSTLSALIVSFCCLLATGKSRFTLEAPVTTLGAWEHCLWSKCKTHLRFRCITNGFSLLFQGAVYSKTLRMWLVVGVTGCFGRVLTVTQSPLPPNALDAVIWTLNILHKPVAVSQRSVRRNSGSTKDSLNTKSSV